MVRVHFSFADEFIAELRLSPPNVEPVVRVTLRFIPTKLQPVQVVQVIASYLRDVSGQLIAVVMEHDCGEYLAPIGGTPERNPAITKAQQVRDEITQAVRGMGLEARAGCYRDGDR